MKKKAKEVKKNEEDVVAKATTIVEPEYELTKVPRKVDGVPYVGVIYMKWRQYCIRVRATIECCADWSDDRIADNVFQGYQAGKHVHMGQQKSKAGKLIAGMELEYVRLQGLRKSKWGHLASFVPQVQADFKLAGIEPTDEQIREVAKEQYDALKANEAARLKLLERYKKNDTVEETVEEEN